MSFTPTVDEENVMRKSVKDEPTEIMGLEDSKLSFEEKQAKLIKKDCLYLRILKDDALPGLNTRLAALLAALDASALLETPHVRVNGPLFPVSPGDASLCGGSDTDPDPFGGGPPAPAGTDWQDPRDWRLYNTINGEVTGVVIVPGIPVKSQVTIDVPAFAGYTPAGGDDLRITYSQDSLPPVGTLYPVDSVVDPNNLVVMGDLVTDGVQIGDKIALQTSGAAGIPYLVRENGQTTTDPEAVEFQDRYETFHKSRWDDLFGTKRELDGAMDQVLQALQRNIVLTQDRNDQFEELLS